MNRQWVDLKTSTALPVESTDVRVCESGYLRAIVSRDLGYWHLSVSHRSGIYPNWDQLADARYDLIPHDVDMALILPPPGNYVNANPGVLQLTEVKDPDMPIDRELRQVRTKLTEGGMRGQE